MKPTSRQNSTQMEPLPPEVRTILQKIEEEPVPERLLHLALQLQRALVDHRKHSKKTGPSAFSPSVGSQPSEETLE